MGGCPGSELLTSTFQRCHAEQSESAGMKLGLGWMIKEQMDGERMLWHNGATYGSHSFVGFVPEKRVGVAVLVNHGVSVWRLLGFGKLPADQIGISMLSKLRTMTFV
jgi:CubicO group peptidase (beta-lactamase class C family)